MVSVPASSTVDCGFEPRSCQAKDYIIDMCCFNGNSAILQLQIYHGENKLILMMMRSAMYQTNKLSWIFIVLAH
jgi:hypothetical protein